MDGAVEVWVWVVVLFSVWEMDQLYAGWDAKLSTYQDCEASLPTTTRAQQQESWNRCCLCDRFVQ